MKPSHIKTKENLKNEKINKKMDKMMKLTQTPTHMKNYEVEKAKMQKSP